MNIHPKINIAPWRKNFEYLEEGYEDSKRLWPYAPDSPEVLSYQLGNYLAGKCTKPDHTLQIENSIDNLRALDQYLRDQEEPEIQLTPEEWEETKKMLEKHKPTPAQAEQNKAEMEAFEKARDAVQAEVEAGRRPARGEIWSTKCVSPVELPNGKWYAHETCPAPDVYLHNKIGDKVWRAYVVTPSFLFPDYAKVPYEDTDMEVSRFGKIEMYVLHRWLSYPVHEDQLSLPNGKPTKYQHLDLGYSKTSVLEPSLQEPSLECLDLERERLMEQAAHLPDFADFHML